MSVCMVGIDHKKADLTLRSRCSFSKVQMQQFYEGVQSLPKVRGCVIVSTCNRTELWMSLSQGASVVPAVFFCDFLHLKKDALKAYLTERADEDAVDHLFRLAAGLESKIVGEGQILTQLKNAVAYARTCYATDNCLEVLFRNAVTAGKRVRTETDFSFEGRSVMQEALRVLALQNFSVSKKRCMVIGNGMMGRLAAQTLLEKGANVIVTVRKYHSGVVEVPEGCSRIAFEKRYEQIAECDMIVSATSSQNYTITKEALGQCGLHKNLVLLDLAVPGDIEPEVRGLSRVSLYDIDAFELQPEQWDQHLEQIEQILQEEKVRFYDWLEGRDFIAQIEAVKQGCAKDVAARLTPSLKQVRLPETAKEQMKKEVCAAAERTMNHILHSLRNEMEADDFHKILDLMNRALL